MRVASNPQTYKESSSALVARFVKVYVSLEKTLYLQDSSAEEASQALEL